MFRLGFNEWHAAQLLKRRWPRAASPSAAGTGETKIIKPNEAKIAMRKLFTVNLQEGT